MCQWHFLALSLINTRRSRVDKTSWDMTLFYIPTPHVCVTPTFDDKICLRVGEGRGYEEAVCIRTPQVLWTHCLRLNFYTLTFILRMSWKTKDEMLIFWLLALFMVSYNVIRLCSDKPSIYTPKIQCFHMKHWMLLTKLAIFK